jgi:hypothetical protein
VKIIAKALGGECVSPNPAIFSVALNLVSYSDNNSALLGVATKMPREAEVSVNERAFIQEALKENIRLDGRAFDAFRPLELTFGDEFGVADVQLGKTRYFILTVTADYIADNIRVIARISVEVTAPPPERKFDGGFQIVTEFSPMASPAFEVGRYVHFGLHKPLHYHKHLTELIDLQMQKSSSHEYLRKLSAVRMH